MSGEYEFSADQNRVIGSVSRNARLAGAMNLALAGAVLFATIKLGNNAAWELAMIGPSLPIVGLIVALTTIYGIWLLRAASRFSKIVSTQGSDMTHLLAGFTELTNIYRVQWVLYIISFILGLILVVFTWVPPALAAMIAFAIFQIVAIGKVFAKAGHSGWAIVVPIYSTLVMLQIAGKPAWWLFLMMLPVVNVVIAALVAISIAKAFGRGVGFGLGLAFVPWVFYPILGFGRAEYFAGAV